MRVYRIIVAGNRGFKNYSLLKEELDRYFRERNIVHGDGDFVNIVSGGCEGADELGEKYAREHGYLLSIFPAEWDKFGASAGPIRNREMAEYAADFDGVLFAFWNGMSKGTKNMIETAEKFGLEVHTVRYDIYA